MFSRKETNAPLFALLFVPEDYLRESLDKTNREELQHQLHLQKEAFGRKAFSDVRQRRDIDWIGREKISNPWRIMDGDHKLKETVGIRGGSLYSKQNEDEPIGTDPQMSIGDHSER